ncbi:MAG: sulfur oxidation c-type cytochrome SoxX [Acidithiobacillus sp.]|uniref:sulfur oxidation c-type cytochrome SoxX n=1 Tax=Acidithiobacillus sp. TaxID=1872118 RepID=UPI003D06D093
MKLDTILRAGMLSSLLGTLLFLGAVDRVQAAENAAAQSNIEAGRAIAFDREKGNCLACHALPGGSQAGNVAPALPMKGVTFQQMFQTKEKLVAFLADPEKLFPYANMPQFGKNDVLTPKELQQVADYLWSLN